MEDQGFNGKQKLMLQSLQIFFNSDEKMQKMIPIVEGTSSISLRLWMVCDKLFKNIYYHLIRMENFIFCLLEL